MLMIKNDVKKKKELTVIDRINMTNFLVEGYFTDGKYTPYYRDLNDIVAFFRYCVDGIEFEKDESVYNSVINDPKLMELYYESPNFLPPELRLQLEKIDSDVTDMVEFRKQCIIHASTKIDDKVKEILDKESQNKDAELKLMQETERLQKAQLKQVEYANKIAEMMSPEDVVKLNELMIKNGEYDPNKVAKYLADNYLNSEHHEENVKSILDSKNEKIKDLEKYKKMYDARNVLADK